jgi:DHA1 family bicyclomycin/chloramphenicol resistance-like MFS transporter
LVTARTVVLGALSAIGPIAIDTYLPGLPQIAADFKAPEPAVQLTITGCLVGLALGQLIAGPLSDALGRRRPLMAGMALFTVASAAAAASPSLAILIAMRVFQGMAGAAGIVIARAAVRDLYEGRDVARMFSILLLVTGVAPILAPVLGAQVMRLTSWRGIFLLLAAVAALLAVSVWLWLPESLPRARRRLGGLADTGRAFRQLAGNRVFMGYALSAAFSFAGLFSYISASPFVLQNGYGLSPQAFSLVFGMNALGIISVSQLNVRLLDRFTPRQLLAAGLTGCAGAGALVLAVAITGAGLAPLLAGLWLGLASFGLVVANAMALALIDHPEMAGSASAQMGALQFAVGALIAPMTGLRWGSPSLPMASAIAGVSVLALVAFLALTRPGPTPRTPRA